jgi:hypothetical protein
VWAFPIKVGIIENPEYLDLSFQRIHKFRRFNIGPFDK